MLRITQYMKELRQPTPLAERRGPSGPVVIWNLVRRCNLCCEHCYSISADVDFPGELTTEQLYRTMDDLKAFGVPVLILSGGEPLLRPDIFDVAGRARHMGFYVGLSTNGTLQLFDESWNLTKGGPAYASMSMSHYLYEVSFQRNPNFGYGAALSYVILILVAVLAFIQLRVGDKRD